MITIVRISPTTVRMGIAAPGNMNIVRSELVKQERSSAKESSQSKNVDGPASGRTADSVRGSGVGREIEPTSSVSSGIAVDAARGCGEESDGKSSNI